MFDWANLILFFFTNHISMEEMKAALTKSRTIQFKNKTFKYFSEKCMNVS